MSLLPARAPPPPPRAPRFLTVREKQWLAQLRQWCCPESQDWEDNLLGIRDDYGNYPDDYWPYVSYLDTLWEETVPCKKPDIDATESGRTPRRPDGGAPSREPVRRGTGPPMPPAFPDWPSPRSVLPQKPYFASSTSNARLRGVLLAGQAQRRKEAATGASEGSRLINRSVDFYVEVPGKEESEIVSVDVTLRKQTTGTGAMEFYLEMLPRTVTKIEEALRNILIPGGRLTRHTLVYFGDEKRLPATDKIVDTRSSIKDAWNIRDMAKTIKEYAETYAKNPSNHARLRIQVACPCPSN